MKPNDPSLQQQRAPGGRGTGTDGGGSVSAPPGVCSLGESSSRPQFIWRAGWNRWLGLRLDRVRHELHPRSRQCARNLCKKRWCRCPSPRVVCFCASQWALDQVPGAASLKPSMCSVRIAQRENNGLRSRKNAVCVCRHKAASATGGALHVRCVACLVPSTHLHKRDTLSQRVLPTCVARAHRVRLMRLRASGPPHPTVASSGNLFVGVGEAQPNNPGSTLQRRDKLKTFLDAVCPRTGLTRRPPTGMQYKNHLQRDKTPPRVRLVPHLPDPFCVTHCLLCA